MNGSSSTENFESPQIIVEQLEIKEELEDLEGKSKTKRRKYTKKAGTKKDKDVGDSISGDNRKAAQATRTLKACDLCRRQKTRCFRSSERNSCLRCIFLNKPCSFELEAVPMPMTNSSISSVMSDNSETDRKLDLIYGGLTEIMSLLKNGNSNISNNNTTSNNNNNNNNSQFSFQSPTTSLKAAPFSIVSNQIPSRDIPKPIYDLLNLSTIKKATTTKAYFEPSDDILSLGILTLAEACDLMNDFRRNYGRWVSFPSSLSTEVLIERIRYKSSLLLTTCCLLSLRYSLNGVSPGDINNFTRKKKTYKDLIKKLVKDLDSSLIKYTAFQGTSDNSGDIEFLQSLVILSIYSLSLSSIVPTTMDDDDDPQGIDSDLAGFNLDAWFLSSIGLTTFITKSTFGTLFKNNNRITSSPNANASTATATTTTTTTSPFTVLYDELDSDEYQTLTILRIYNHLCLVHLINCVFSGRMCVVDEIRLNYCTATLSLPSATNFDGRMVSEIGILLIAYNFVQVQFNNVSSTRDLRELEIGFKTVKEELRMWYDQWEYLFSQPNLQFVELNYNFCSLVIYYCYNFSRTSVIKPFKKDASPSTINDNSSLYDENNIQYILANTNKDGLIKMVGHAYKVVRFVNAIESDSYFAYLSDQIHFCFYFSAICLMNLLKYLHKSRQLTILDEVSENDPELMIASTNYHPITEDLRTLIDKFSRVGQDNQDDIISKYKVGLNTLLKENFAL
ncbi:uncharacterized protein RJT21DRAFT_130587 [Scheffersomyces amazonensis]|uniref:uncharacterized protein n=1 Tax=Scheffersomyces amazonensis TaxID=1078765 RepID=UPI00315D1388